MASSNIPDSGFSDNLGPRVEKIMDTKEPHQPTVGKRPLLETTNIWGLFVTAA